MPGERLLEREEELSELRAAWTRARSGNGGLVVVEGPAGSGKSALLGAAKERANAAGMRVLDARGSELEVGLAFGAIRQLFEKVITDAPVAAIVRTFIPDADDALSNACHTATAGNPFYLLELLPLLRAVAEAATGDEQIRHDYETMRRRFDEFAEQSLRGVADLGRTPPADLSETARALNLMGVSYLLDALGREPRVPPQTAVQTLTMIWEAVIRR